MIGNIIQQNLMLGFNSRRLLKTGDRRSTQLTHMSIDPKFVELTTDVVRIILQHTKCENDGREGHKKKQEWTTRLRTAYPISIAAAVVEVSRTKWI